MSSPSYDEVRVAFLASYKHELQQGTIVPFIWPFSLLSHGVLIAYLQFSCYEAVRRTKYAVFLVICGLSLHTMLYCRTLGLAYGVATALIAAWSVMLAGTLMIAREPHAEFKRLVPKKQARVLGGSTESRECEQQNSLADGNGKRNEHMRKEHHAAFKDYEWQSMPSDFFPRLVWVYDLVSCFRGPHWSWSHRDNPLAPSIQNPSPRPAKRRAPPNLGYSFLRFGAAYMTIDVLKAIMIADPYFLGLGKALPPSYLPSSSFLFHPMIIRMIRFIMSFSGIVAALHYSNELMGLICYHILPAGATIGDHSIADFYAPLFGQTVAVFDYGLAGFWNAYWHQIFRFAFISTGRSIANSLGYRGRSTQAKAIIMIVAFALSGFGHAAAAYMVFGNKDHAISDALHTFAFFALQPVAIVLQLLILPPPNPTEVKNGIKASFSRRLLNLVFVLGWFWTTFPLLADPLATGGLWLFEPLPISFIRGLGLSRDKRLWCWVGDWGRWIWDDKQWWRSGYHIL